MFANTARIYDASNPIHNRGFDATVRRSSGASAASDGRKNLIRTILTERVVSTEERARIEATLPTMTTAVAIDTVARLKALPRVAAGQPQQAERKTTVTVLEEGFYLFDNEAFRVKRTKDGQRFYAQRATGRGWDYESAKGVVYKLDPSMLMTGVEIARFGKLRGFCVNCSHGLEDLVSQGVGLGTECGPKILGKDGYKAARLAAIEADPEVAAYVEMKKAGAKARREAAKLQAVV